MWCINRGIWHSNGSSSSNIGSFVIIVIVGSIRLDDNDNRNGMIFN